MFLCGVTLYIVMEEIEERRQFLSEMEALGQGKEHRHKIMTEISQVCHLSVYMLCI